MARLIVSLLCSCVLACASPARAQSTAETPRDAPGIPAETGTLRGRVYAGATKRPLSGAQIRLLVPNVRQNAANVAQAISDADGRFVFEQVAPGPYVLTAQKAGYVTMNFGQERWSDPYDPISLQPGQLMDALDLTLPAGAAITGTIVDETGRPVRDVLVTALRRVFTRGGQKLTTAGRSATTNDLGEFRLSSLPPGDYYMLTTFRPGWQLARGTRDYAPGFYPGTADIGAAEAITLAAGRTVSGIRMALPSVRAARVSGTALTSDGQPFSGFVSVFSRHGQLDDGVAVAPAQIRADGSFVIAGVPPGVHRLSVVDRSVERPDREFATTEINVTGTDLTDVQLVGATPSTITGRITFASGDPAALTPSAWSVGATLITPTGDDFLPLPRIPVRDDWSFEAKTWPGLVQLDVFGPRTGPWRTKAVNYGGADVTDVGLDIRARVDASDVDIELTDQRSGVCGVVTNGRKKVVNRPWIVVFARDPGQRVIPRYVRYARADQDGHFSLANLPATDYLVTALPSIDTGIIHDPGLLTRLEIHAVPVTLREDERDTPVTLTAVQDLPR